MVPTTTDYDGDVIDRCSTLLVRTLREDPADAEVASHRLLVRAGYIRRQAPGVFAWLPLGLRVKRRLEQIVREEMHRAGAQEVLFPALMPAELYERTNRLGDFGAAMFSLTDRKETPMVLAPTHEEAFTLTVKDLCGSYKDLPLQLYQFQDKYRDEARPRAGLIRGREFTMKDAYSFDIDDEGLAKSYQAQRDAYERIFQRLGLNYVIVTADAGAMGGSKSEEFHHLTEIGEDTLVVSDGGYAANTEAYRATPPTPADASQVPPMTEFVTPNCTTIDALVRVASQALEHEVSAQHTLKHVAVAVLHRDAPREVVVIALPGDRQLDEARAEIALGAPVEQATEEDLRAHPEIVPGYIGPCRDGAQVLGTEHGSVRYLLDVTATEGLGWIVGAGKKDAHIANVLFGRDVVADGTIDCAEVRDGDLAPDGSGPVRLVRGTEIGHVFQLGRKYAEALGLRVLDQNGKLVTVTMGSYGLGITRDLAIILEDNHDEKGIIWPESIAPYDLYLVATGKDSAAFELAEKLAEQAASAHLEVLIDDRPKVSPGVKFGDAELIGVPWIIICGRDAAAGRVELWNRRTGERETIEADRALERLAELRGVSSNA